MKPNQLKEIFEHIEARKKKSESFSLSYSQTLTQTCACACFVFPQVTGAVLFHESARGITHAVLHVDTHTSTRSTWL